MRVSVVVAVYKDVQALSLIVEALKQQTYKNFEVVVAEDGQNEAMDKYIKSIQGLRVKHATQEDLGIRKTRSLNNGIIASEGEYLIFIDGDCVPYSTFIQNHVALAEAGVVLSGRRVNLGPRYSAMLRSGKISSLRLERTFALRFPLIALDCKENHSEDGFCFSPTGLVYRMFLSKRRASTGLLGCNYSCFKKDMMAINGYDEGYGETAVGDDTDLEWRFRTYGCEVRSVKNVANVFHLYHSRGFRNSVDSTEALEQMRLNKANGLFECKSGVKQH